MSDINSFIFYANDTQIIKDMFEFFLMIYVLNVRYRQDLWRHPAIIPMKIAGKTLIKKIDLKLIPDTLQISNKYNTPGNIYCYVVGAKKTLKKQRKKTNTFNRYNHDSLSLSVVEEASRINNTHFWTVNTRHYIAALKLL